MALGGGAAQLDLEPSPDASVAELRCKIRPVDCVSRCMRACIGFFCWLQLMSTVGLAASTGHRLAAAIETPEPGSMAAMERWQSIYQREMKPLRLHWTRLVKAIHRGRISELPTLCPRFQSALAAVDRQALVSAEDLVVRANIAGVLEQLDGAAGRCRRDRFFDLSFQLYKAGYLLQVVDRRLQRYHRPAVE
jgi:hypothetical protein